ncbi:hypothetical protein AcV7_009214 [Taiwanofungus camphoratus]|nr:hypothetical protein AcV7_009214 [Antrodia cinnamomea]
MTFTGHDSDPFDWLWDVNSYADSTLRMFDSGLGNTIRVATTSVSSAAPRSLDEISGTSPPVPIDASL